MGTQSRREMGMAEPLLILLIVIVIAVVGFAGWYVYHKRQENKTTTSSSAVSSTQAAGVNAACNAVYHDNVLCRSAAYMDLSKIPYTAVFTSTQSSGGGTFNLKSDGKGNTSLTSSGSGASISSVQLNGNTYVQQPGSSTWLEYAPTSGSSSTPPTTNPSKDVSLGFANTVKYKNLGKVSCGSATCYEYQVTDSTQPGTTQDIWINASTYYLSKWTETSSSGTMTMTLSYGAVTIMAPSPVQKVSY